MQSIRDIHLLDLPVKEKYERIIQVLPDLKDDTFFESVYISTNSLDEAICETKYIYEYFSYYSLEYLCDLAVQHNYWFIYEIIYRKSNNVTTTYNMLNSKLEDRKFPYYGFIKGAIRENNKEFYTKIIRQGNTELSYGGDFDGDDKKEVRQIHDLDMLRFVLPTVRECNNKEFIYGFIVKYPVEQILRACINFKVDVNVFLIKILSEYNNIDDLVKCRLMPSIPVFQSFEQAGASREALINVYGKNQFFREWIEHCDV